MIVAQSVRTIQAMQRENELSKAHTEQEHLLATRAHLQEVSVVLNDLISTYATVGDCLTHDQMTLTYQQQFHGLVQAFDSSQQQFHTERRQVHSLRGVGQRIERLRKLLDQAWYAHAQTQLDPYASLTNLVRSLPEIRDQLSEIDKLLADLQQRLASAPANADARAQFDAKLQELVQHLESIEGLNESVLAFLSRVADGTATLADLDDETLQWCRQAQRATAFEITFKAG